MKKGFTMIELIFVIVILGILASVAIPRLAATREDAEISTGIANIRTLLSDATSYYVTKGGFNSVKWRDLTNVPLNNADAIVGNAGGTATLEVGGKDCLRIGIGNTAESTFFIFTKIAANTDPICTTFLETDSIKQLLASTIPPNHNDPNDSYRNMCIGISKGGMSCVPISSSSIY